MEGPGGASLPVDPHRHHDGPRRPCHHGPLPQDQEIKTPGEEEREDDEERPQEDREDPRQVRVRGHGGGQERRQDRHGRT